MEREIIKIDEELCNGCGLCIPNCHEGALQIIDNKARLISDLMCDGLGACIGHCPKGAITIEKREAEPYNETKVMVDMVKKGRNTVIAHLKHMLEHNEIAFLKEGIDYMKNNPSKLTFDLKEVIDEVYDNKPETDTECSIGGCPGSQSQTFSKTNSFQLAPSKTDQASQLGHWPVQLHLINPAAPFFRNSDLLIASDCSAFSLGNFHSKWLKGKSLVIACPKLDTGIETYINKISLLIKEAKVNTITVLMMEVPCCGGLLRIINEARQMTLRKVPVKAVIVSTKGVILKEQWL